MENYVPLIVLLVLGPIIAVVAYREATAFRSANGVSPWGIPPAAWAAAAVPFLAITAILLAVAKATTRPKATATGGSQLPFSTGFGGGR